LVKEDTTASENFTVVVKSTARVTVDKVGCSTSELWLAPGELACGAMVTTNKAERTVDSTKAGVRGAITC
jgi:hypothetical protein